MRSAAGQSSTEYVGLVLLCVVVLAALAVPVARLDVAGPLAEATRAAVCRVTGAICSGRGRPPCRVAGRSNREDVRLRVAVEVRGGAELLIERFSDGSATVAFADSIGAGAAYGLGVRVGDAVDAGGDASAGVQFTGGRRWRFPTWAAAAGFLARHARRETLTGEGRAALRAICLPCRLAGSGPGTRPAAPDERWLEGGRYADLDAGLTAVLPRTGRANPTGGRRGGNEPRSDGEPDGGAERAADARASLELVSVLGRRLDDRARETTWYLRVSGTATASLGAVIGSLAASPHAEVVVEYTAGLRGEPVRMRLAAAGQITAGGGLAGNLGLPQVSVRLRREAAAAAAGRGERGDALEGFVELDLRDAANAAAARRFLAALRPGRWAAAGIEAVRLGRHLDRHGRVDLRTYAVARDEAGGGAGGGIGWQVGGDYRRTERGDRLTGAWTRDPGDVLLRREDCLHPSPSS